MFKILNDIEIVVTKFYKNENNPSKAKHRHRTLNIYVGGTGSRETLIVKFCKRLQETFKHLVNVNMNMTANHRTSATAKKVEETV